MTQQLVHLVDLLDTARIEAPGADHVNLQTFVLDRLARPGLFQHPPSVVRFDGLALGRDPVLSFYPLIKHTAWQRMSGPVAFRVLVITDSETQLVYERPLDPREPGPDRKWQRQEIDLAAWQNKTVSLAFQTRAPDGGGVDFGWAGWAEPQLTHRIRPPVARRPRGGRAGRPKRPNVLLITCDALRRDHLGCYGGDKVPTPHIDRLASDGLLFDDARASSDATMASYAGLLTGNLPPRTGVFDEWGTIPGYVPALPTWLAAQGYRTVLAASERELATPEPGVTRLFERVVATLGHPAQPSAVTARRLVHALEDQQAPWFAWAQLFDPHPPTLPGAAAARAAYPHDPTSKAQRFRPELMAKIGGVEAVKEFTDQPADRTARTLPPRILHRLRATAAALRNPALSGPDLTSHIPNLGRAAMADMAKPAFLNWLDGQLEQAAAGGDQRELVAWYRTLVTLLEPVQDDIIFWLDGVVDFRYPQAMYAACVGEADAAIGLMLDRLAAAGALDSCWIILTAPHGEYLGEEPLVFSHHLPAETAIRVPLIIRPPAGHDLKRGTKVIGMFDLIDLFPTLAAWLGAPELPYIDGRNRAAGIESGRISRRGPSIAVAMNGGYAAICAPPYKLVRSYIADETWPWLDRQRPRDGRYLFNISDETREISGGNREVKQKLAKALEERLALAAAHSGTDWPVFPEPT
jgi:hypothetical protein